MLLEPCQHCGAINSLQRHFDTQGIMCIRCGVIDFHDDVIMTSTSERHQSCLDYRAPQYSVERQFVDHINNITGTISPPIETLQMLGQHMQHGEPLSYENVKLLLKQIGCPQLYKHIPAIRAHFQPHTRVNIEQRDIRILLAAFRDVMHVVRPGKKIPSYCLLILQLCKQLYGPNAAICSLIHANIRILCPIPLRRFNLFWQDVSIQLGYTFIPVSQEPDPVHIEPHTASD